MEPIPLDYSNSGKGLWLVKVPKYLSNEWEKADRGSEVGRLRMTVSKAPGKTKQEVIFELSDKLVKDSQVPREHGFALSEIDRQSLMVFSEGTDATGNASVSVVGKIMKRAECRPLVDANYLKLKRTQIKNATEPKRQVQALDKVVQNYKPTDKPAGRRELEQKKKEEGRRERQDKDVVQNKLFGAFEKHQYYNISDLVRITKQPVNYLKEILKDICHYNVKAPHRHMWELKPEFRHYKQSTDTG